MKENSIAVVLPQKLEALEETSEPITPTEEKVEVIKVFEHVCLFCVVVCKPFHVNPN